MAFSLNKIMLIGNLGQDAETRFSNNNVGITSFSIATTYSYKGKDGQWVKQTTWHNIVGFNLSDYYKENLKKGKKFYVEGRLNKREYEQEGVKKYFTEVVLDKLIPLDASGGYDNSNQESNHAGEPVNAPGAEDEDLPF